jgi:hypothetical protein
MTSFRTAFADEFGFDIMGQITGSTDVSRMPDVPGQLFRLKADSSNDESFWLGTSSGTQPFEMAAGDDTDWFTFMGDNLNNLFYYNSSGSTETMAYWIQK